MQLITQKLQKIRIYAVGYNFIRIYFFHTGCIQCNIWISRVTQSKRSCAQKLGYNIECQTTAAGPCAWFWKHVVVINFIAATIVQFKLVNKLSKWLWHPITFSQSLNACSSNDGDKTLDEVIPTQYWKLIKQSSLRMMGRDARRPINFNTRPLQCNDKEKGMRPKVKQFDYRVFSDVVKFGFRWLKFFQRNLQSR